MQKGIGGINMKRAYPVIFTLTKDKKNTILIEVPDLDIFTEGYGIEDAIEMARDAIGLKGVTLEDMKKDISPASEVSAIIPQEGEFAEEGESFISMVDIDFLEYRRKKDQKAVRRNVTLPSWLNFEAEKAGINVSKVLQEALLSTLGLSK